jgi:hypothetical protein
MNTQELAACEAMYHALELLPCACTHNVPYAGGQVEQVVTHMCSRCRAMRQWEAIAIEEAA